MQYPERMRRSGEEWYKNRSIGEADKKFSFLENFLHDNVIEFGDCTLKSGMMTPIYIDLRQVVFFGRRHCLNSDLHVVTVNISKSNVVFFFFSKFSHV